MLYREWADSLERKPYPSIEAIANVFQLAVRRNPEVASFNPLALWNTHYVRELDDSGYKRLYQSTLPIKKGGVENPAFWSALPELCCNLSLLTLCQSFGSLLRRAWFGLW